MRTLLLSSLLAGSVLAVSSLGADSPPNQSTQDNIEQQCKAAVAEMCKAIQKLQPKYSELSTFRGNESSSALSLEYRHNVKWIIAPSEEITINSHYEAQKDGCFIHVQFLGHSWQNDGSGPNQKSFYEWSRPLSNIFVQAVINSPNAELVGVLEKIVRTNVPRITEK